MIPLLMLVLAGQVATETPLQARVREFEGLVEAMCVGKTYISSQIWSDTESLAIQEAVAYCRAEKGLPGSPNATIPGLDALRARVDALEKRVKELEAKAAPSCDRARELQREKSRLEALMVKGASQRAAYAAAMDAWQKAAKECLDDKEKR